MALTVQNDQGTVDNANSYITVAAFKAYHDDRNNDYGTATDTAIAGAAVKGTDYLDERWPYKGVKAAGISQTTEFPRVGVVNRQKQTVTGIPQAVLEATCEYALRALLNGELNPDPGGVEIISSLSQTLEGLGSKSVTYDVSDALEDKYEYPAADEKLRKAGLIQNTMSRDLRRG